MTYSSISAAIGNHGQTAYAAANRFLDALIHIRVRAGLCGVSIQWPAISGIGMAAASNSLQDDRWSLSPERVYEHLYQCFKGAYLSLQRPVLILPESYLKVFNSDNGFGLQLREYMKTIVVDSKVYQGASNTTKKKMMMMRDRHKVHGKAAIPVAQVKGIIIKAVESVLDSSKTVGENDQLMEVGVDSLGASQLSSILSKQFGIAIFPTLLFNYPTIQDIEGYIKLQLYEDDSGNAAAGTTAAGNDDHLDGTQGLNKDQGGDKGDIAIIGTSCTLPGDVTTADELWHMMDSSTTVTGEVSLRRWDSDAIICSLRKRNIVDEHS